MVEMVENTFEISAPNPNCGNGGNGPNGGNHFRFGPQPQWSKWWNWWQSLEISPLPQWWKWWKSFRFSHNPNGGENGVNHSWDLAPIPIGEIVEIVELQIWPQPQRWNCWKWWKSFHIFPQTPIFRGVQYTKKYHYVLELLATIRYTLEHSHEYRTLYYQPLACLWALEKSKIRSKVSR